MPTFFALSPGDTEKPCAAAAARGRAARFAIRKNFLAGSPLAKNSCRGGTVTRKRVMGSHFTCETFDGKLNSSEFRRQYEARISELLSEYGTDAYNGTLTTTSGLRIEEKTFDSRQAAEDYVSENTQKWGEALAVKFRNVRTEVAKQPTYNGKDLQYNIGAYANEQTLRTVTVFTTEGGRVPVAADGLTASQKATVVALYSDYATKLQAFHVLHKAVREMLGRMEPAGSEPPTTAQMRELQKAIKQRLKAHVVSQKATDKLLAFDAKYTPKIYATKQVDHGVQWLVGGRAAE